MYIKKEVSYTLTLTDQEFRHLATCLHLASKGWERPKTLGDIIEGQMFYDERDFANRMLDRIKAMP